MVLIAGGLGAFVVILMDTISYLRKNICRRSRLQRFRGSKVPFSSPD